MSLDPSKFKNNQKKESEKIAIVVIVCMLLTNLTFGLSLIYMFYYLIKQSNKTINKNASSYKTEKKDNLFEELQDDSTKDYYRYDKNDISQQEIHEHREDFWNVNSPIKYK